MVVIGGSATATANAVNFGVADSGLYKQLAGNGTIAGATSSTLGGIVSASLATMAMTEYTTAATIAAMSLYAKVVGW
jgi:hypothetical protein